MNTIRSVIDFLGVSLEELRSKRRTQRLADARSMLAASLPVSQQQVAAILGCTQPAVHKMRRRHEALVQCDAAYRSVWKALLSYHGS